MGPASDGTQLRRNWAFMFNSLGFSIIVLAIFFEYSPYMDVNNPRMEEIRVVEKTIKRVIPKHVLRMLVSDDGRPVMAVFYASWCSFCATEMPVILETLEEHKLDWVKPVFISMDSQPRVYSKYLVSTQYYKKFPPVMLQEIFYNNLAEVMSTTGSSFNGAIPYIGFFDSRGKMVAEIFGLVDKQGLIKVAEAVK